MPSSFSPTLFRFLRQLSRNNNRDWFRENKPRYEHDVLEPSLAFIRAFRPRLKKISEFFTAIDKRSGGSLMRVYRDTRFHDADEPYKTNVGIQFRHEFGCDIHAPGFYVHLEPDTCFLAAGLWRPDSVTLLRRVREKIVDDPKHWRRIRNTELPPAKAGGLLKLVVSSGLKSFAHDFSHTISNFLSFFNLEVVAAIRRFATFLVANVLLDYFIRDISARRHKVATSPKMPTPVLTLKMLELHHQFSGGLPFDQLHDLAR